MKPVILDCTLRDGGYVNNWQFDEAASGCIINGLYEAGIRCIEIGIMGEGGIRGKQTKFSDFDDISPLLANRKDDCSYAVMVTSTTADKFTYPPCSSSTPDIIRIAYFKQELDKTILFAQQLKALGYKVFLQAMATFMYSDTEMTEMVRRVNTLKPAAFYMVDSFSTMYPEDTAKMRDRVLSVLEPDIIFGFHAHNNIQMAYANVREFLNTNTEHSLMVDASIYGMGRGAGNVPLELIMEFMNKKYGSNFNYTDILHLYQNILEPIYNEYHWGYSAPYYLTAVNKLNSVWGWFFMSKGITDIQQLDRAVKMVPDETKYTLNKDIGNKIVSLVRDN